MKITIQSNNRGGSFTDVSFDVQDELGHFTGSAKASESDSTKGINGGRIYELWMENHRAQCVAHFYDGKWCSNTQNTANSLPVFHTIKSMIECL